MSVNSASPEPQGKVKAFGPNNELLCTLSDARGGKSSVGAILWGLGVAEIKTARRLAKNGIVSLQLRINGPEFYNDARRNEIYRRRGVDYTKLAMDKLAAEHGVTSFILMGNCACANLCFHAAVRDSRVVGLILTNPYIAQAQLLRTVLWRKLAKAIGWKRLATDTAARATAQFRSLMHLLADRLMPTRPTEDNASRIETCQTIELPWDLGRVLRSLCEREVKILVASTTSDDSFLYLRQRHGAELDVIESEGNFHFAAVASSAHVFSRDDAAAGLLNDAISAWMDGTSFTANAAAERVGTCDFDSGRALDRSLWT